MVGLMYNLWDMEAGFYPLSLENSIDKLENVFYYIQSISLTIKTVKKTKKYYFALVIFQKKTPVKL